MGKYKDWNELMPVLEKILNNHKSCALLGGKDYDGRERGNSFSMLDDEKRPFQCDNKNNLFDCILIAVEEYETHNNTDRP